MFADLLTPPYVPFAIAFVIMLGIGLIEAIGLGLGHVDLGTSGGVDADGGLLDWLGLGGELPILIWLTSLLGCFTITGIAIQQATTGITGAPLHAGVAFGAALIVGLALNTLAANGLARLMPRFESTAITTDDLLRHRGTILEGTARPGHPARAKIVDRHGQAHVVMVEPHDLAEAIAEGETVLLVRREGALFYALPERDALLRSI